MFMQARFSEKRDESDEFDEVGLRGKAYSLWELEGGPGKRCGMLPWSGLGVAMRLAAWGRSGLLYTHERGQGDGRSAKWLAVGEILIFFRCDSLLEPCVTRRLRCADERQGAVPICQAPFLRQSPLRHPQ